MVSRRMWGLWWVGFLAALVSIALSVWSLTDAEGQTTTTTTTTTSPACPVEGAGDCRSCPEVPNPYDACLEDDVPPWGDDPGTPGQPNGVNCLVTPEHEACPRGDDREQVEEVEPGRWCVIGDPRCVVTVPKFTG